MTISGVVMNGRVEFTERVNLPDGTPISADLVQIEPLAELYDRGQTLRELREARADLRAGNALDAETAFARLNAEFGFDPVIED